MTVCGFMGCYVPLFFGLVQWFPGGNQLRLQEAAAPGQEIVQYKKLQHFSVF